MLGTAETRGVPARLAAGDTLSIVERAGSLLDPGHARDAGTVTRMRGLRHGHTGIDTILGYDNSAADPCTGE